MLSMPFSATVLLLVAAALTVLSVVLLVRTVTASTSAPRRYRYPTTSTEAFDGSDGSDGSGASTDASDPGAVEGAFTSLQSSGYAQGTTRPVYINTGLLSTLAAAPPPAGAGNPTTIDAALNTVGVGLPTTGLGEDAPPPRSRLPTFVEDPVAGLAAADAAQCAASDPSALPRYGEPGVVPAGGALVRTPACGWWFVPTPGEASTGALGTPTGPLDPARLATSNPGGRWVWNLAVAKRLEDIKACAGVTSCAALPSGGGGACGFCTATGTGVPVNADGSLKYAGTCAVAPLTDAGSCAAALATAGATGSASAVTVDASGVVTIGPAAAAAPTDACSVMGSGSSGSSGGVSRACLLLLAAASPKPPAAAGFGPGSALLAALRGSTSVDAGSLRGALDVVSGALGGDAATTALAAAAMSPASTPVGAALSRDAALALFGRLLALQAPSSTGSSSSTGAGSSRLARALRYLIVGGSYDPCDFDSGDSGPFPASCVALAFTQAGCQASGTAYPGTSAAAAAAVSAAGGTWGGLRAYFAQMRAACAPAAAAAAPDGGDGAVRACLGVTVLRPPPPPPTSCAATPLAAPSFYDTSATLTSSTVYVWKDASVQLYTITVVRASDGTTVYTGQLTASDVSDYGVFPFGTSNVVPGVAYTVTVTASGPDGQTSSASKPLLVPASS